MKVNICRIYDKIGYNAQRERETRVQETKDQEAGDYRPGGLGKNNSWMEI